MSNPFSAYICELAALISAGRFDPGSFEPFALRLFRLQYEAVPVFRSWCDQQGANPAKVQKWSEIPALPASAFKDFEVTSLPPSGRTRTFHSSGTTEQRRSRHFHDQESLGLYEASLRQGFKSMVLPRLENPPHECLFLTPPPELTPHSSLNHMFGCFGGEFLGNMGPAGDWLLPPDIIERLRGMKRPLFLCGTAFSFVHLLDAPGSTSIPLPPGSALFETGGYKGRSRVVARDELHALLSRKLSVPSNRIICEYGMSELSSQAYGLGGPLAFPPWARPLIVSPETGRQAETGLLRIFDLANARSVLAIQTEDLAQDRADRTDQPSFTLLGRFQEAEPRGCSLLPA